MADTLARMRQIVGTTADWGAHDLVLGDGEVALERIDAATVRARIGDGVKPFSQAPYLGSALDLAAADARYVQEAETFVVGGGAAANRWPRLDATGKIDPSMVTIPTVLKYKGVIDATQPPPGGTATGDLYVNNTEGAVNAAWGAPAAGQTINPGDWLILNNTGLWQVVPMTAGIVSEAPADGFTYGRRNGAWSATHYAGGPIIMGPNNIFGGAPNSSLAFNAGAVFAQDGASIALRGQTTGYNPHGMEFYTGDLERMRLDAAGNLGVGRAATTSGIDVYRAGDACVRIVNTQCTVDFTTNGINARITNLNAGSLNLATNNIDRIGITAAGDVYIPGIIHAGADVNANVFRVAPVANGYAYLGSSSPTKPVLNFDANDYILYDQAIDQMLFSVGGVLGMNISPGRILSPTVAAGDNGFFLSADANYANINVDANDWLRYNRAANAYEFIINNVVVATVSANLTIPGTINVGGFYYGGKVHAVSAGDGASFDARDQAGNPKNTLLRFTDHDTTAVYATIGYSGGSQLTINNGIGDLILAASGWIYHQSNTQLNADIFQPAMPTTTASGNAVYASGNANQRLRSTSSRRYKTNIADLPDAAADALLALRPVAFTSLCEVDDPETVHFGFIAEEVAEINPSLVAFGFDGPHEDDAEPVPTGLQYNELIALLTATAQRQAETIKGLAERLAALEAA